MVSKKRLDDNAVPDEELIAEIDPKVYNDIARCARLLAVQLIDSSFTISPSFFDDMAENKHSVDFSDVHGGFDEGSRVATCIFSLESSIKKGKKKVFSCKAKFVVFYDVSAACDETHAVAFARKTGLVACYPYFRAYVATTASMANADVPILPTISAMPVRQKIKEA